MRVEFFSKLSYLNFKLKLFLNQEKRVYLYSSFIGSLLWTSLFFIIYCKIPKVCLVCFGCTWLNMYKQIYHSYFLSVIPKMWLRSFSIFPKINCRVIDFTIALIDITQSCIFMEIFSIGLLHFIRKALCPLKYWCLTLFYLPLGLIDYIS